MSRRTPLQNPVIRFRIDFAENSYVGPGKIDLLEAIKDSGSLSQAARDLGMSYRRAWLLITTGGKGFTASFATCSGNLQAISFDADYILTKRFDVYAGMMYSGVHDGLANGYIFHTTELNPTVGVRFKF